MQDWRIFKKRKDFQWIKKNYSRKKVGEEGEKGEEFSFKRIPSQTKINSSPGMNDS